MIRLVVKDQNTAETYNVDLLGSENISLTLQVDDVKDISSKNASYSKSFNVPATKNNNRIFEHFYKLDRHTNTYSAYKNTKAYLYDGSVLIFEGLIKLLGSTDKDGELFYSIVLFDDLVSLFDSIGDATIADLDFSELNHEITTANIENSWTATGVTLAAGGTSTNVFYPLVDLGNMEVADGYILFNYAKNYALNLKLKYVIDKIFTYAGFTHDSTFFDSTDFNNIYFDTNFSITEADVVGHTIIADTLEGLPIDLPTLGTAITWNFTNEEGDVNNNLDHDTGIFTATHDCTINIALTLPLVSAVAWEDIFFEAHIYNASNTLVGTTNLGVYYTPANPFGVDAGFTRTFQGSVDLAEDHYVKLLVGDALGTITDIETTVDTDEASGLSIQVTPQTPTEEMIAKGIGDASLKDIVKDVFTLFNLTVQAKENNVLKIETYDTYTTDEVIDWTSKVDYQQKVIEPIEIPKYIEFKHAEDSSDYYKNQYKDRNGAGYGDFKLTFDVDNYDTKTIEAKVFGAPYIGDALGAVGLYTQVATEADGELFKEYSNKPRLVYKRTFTNDASFLLFGASSWGNFGLWNGGLEPPAYITNFLTYTVNATHFSNSLQTASTGNSLLFGTINTDHLPTMLGQTTDTLFNKYWFDYIKERYNTENSILVKMTAELTAADIRAFSFDKLITIENQKYRVNKIEYNTDDAKTSKLELLRI